MSNIKYSQEEVERKRLQAIERRQRIRQESVRRNGPTAVKPASPCAPASGNGRYTAERKDVRGNDQSPGGNGQFSSPKHGQQNGDRLVARPQSQPVRFDPIGRKTPESFFGKSKTAATGQCFMISNTRFGVQTSCFHQQAMEVFKTIPSRLYNAQSRIWDFHINDYEKLMPKLVLLKPDFCVSGLPTFVLQTFKKSLAVEDDIDLSPIDPKLVESLMPFQRDGICYGISKSGRCFIADDMGLGKTIQALGIAHYYKHDWPLLIVSPSSVRYQWSEAIQKFLPSVPMHNVQHFTNSRDCISDAEVTIVSYELLVRSIETFEKHFFGVIILDESHFLKNFKTARTKAALRLTKQTNRIILLSGTPALSRPMELYSQICTVCPRFMGIHEYGVRYCAGVKKQFGWDFNGSSNLQELEILLRARCLIRRLKSEVLTQLPPKRRDMIILDPGLIKAGTKEMEQLSTNFERKNLHGVEKYNALLQYYNETGKVKLKAISNYISDLLESRRKFLVFAHHKVVLNAIADVVETQKIRYIRIDGATSPQERKSQCDLFQDNDDYLVAVLSITSANAGITLTAAQLVVFAELFWNPGILCQAEDRVHRIGQQDSVVIKYLVARQTADDYLWMMIQSKLEVLSGAGLNQNFSLMSANMMNQKPTDDGQTKLDSYITRPDVGQSSLDSYFTRPVSQAKLQTFIARSSEANVKTGATMNTTNETQDDFNHLLDLDDDDLAAIDLNITE